LLDTSEYTDTGGSTGTVTFAIGCTLGDQVCIMSFKSSNTTSGVYASFTRSTATLSGVNSYTPASITSGYELLFLNGIVLTDQDYDVVSGSITNFPSLTTGKLTIIEWTPNNLSTPAGNPVNSLINSSVGQTVYAFNYTANAFNLYMNGVLLTLTSDFTPTIDDYSLNATPTTNLENQLRQTFARTGAV